MTVHVPPHFLSLLAHDVRWQLLSLLAQSDYRVHELVEQTGRPMNLVSYHLGKLRGSELVHERRSSADGRDVYYSLDLERMRTLLNEAGMQLHPSLCAQADAPSSPMSAREAPVRVLFLCTRNSARSQMAEGLLRHIGGDAVQAFSAGDDPGGVHPYAVRALAEQGIDISGQRGKHKDVYDGERFDYVVTVCDFARENCPAYANHPVHIHWSIADPVARSGESDYADFVEAAHTIRARVRHLLTRIAADPASASEASTQVTQEKSRP